MRDLSRKNKHSPEARAMILRMIDESPNEEKKRILHKYQTILETDPEDFAYLLLKVSQGNPHANFIKPFVQKASMEKTYLVQFLKRKSLVNNIKFYYKKSRSFKAHEGNSERILSKNIKGYLKLVDSLEQVVFKSMESGDWTVQVIGLSYLEKEISKFYDFIINTPRPQNLTPEEEQEYIALLLKRMAPYKKKKEELLVRTQELWKDSDFLQSYKIGFQMDPLFHSLLKWEIQELSQVSPLHTQEDLQRLIKRESRPSRKKVKMSKVEESEIVSIQQALSKKPFDWKNLKRLMEMESKRDNFAMVYYLKGRIQKLKEAKKGRVNL